MTDDDGVARLAYGVPDGAAENAYVITAGFAGDDEHESAAGTGYLCVTKAGTSLYALDRSGVITTLTYLRAYLSRTTDGRGVPGGRIDFAIDGSTIGSATTDTDGRATYPWTIACTPGEHCLSATFPGDAAYLSCTSTAVLTATVRATKVHVPNRSGQVKQTAVLRAYLFDHANVAIANKTLTITVDGSEVASRSTDGAGRVQVSYVVPEGLGAGTRSIGSTFAGDAGHTPSSGAGVLTVAPGDLTLWLYVRSGKAGTAHALKAYVRSLPDWTIQPGKEITFRVDGTAVGSAVVADSGWAAVTWLIPIDEPVGAHTASAVFAGDAAFSPVTRETTFNVVP